MTKTAALLCDALRSELLPQLTIASDCPCPRRLEKPVAKDKEHDAAVARSQNTWCVLCSFYLGLVTRGFSTQQQLIPSTIKKI